MSFTAIFTGIVAISEAIPAFKSILESFNDYYIDYQISKIQKRKITMRDSRNVLLKSIKGAKSNEERKVLSAMLSDINLGKLPTSKDR